MIKEKNLAISQKPGKNRSQIAKESPSKELPVGLIIFAIGTAEIMGIGVFLVT